MAEAASALELDAVSSGYGETVIVENVHLALKARRDASDHRTQRGRQDHAVVQRDGA